LQGEKIAIEATILCFDWASGLTPTFDEGDLLLVKDL
jgi:hypothetical protein